MKLKFIRQGFANNSSSSHSIIFTKKNLRDDYEGSFGWDYFTVESSYGKQEYLLQTLFSVFSYETISTWQFYSKRKIGERDWAIHPVLLNTGENKFQLKLGTYENHDGLVQMYLKSTGILDVFPDGEQIIKNFDKYYGVDHQSVLEFPTDLDGNIHIGFLKDFCEYLINEPFAILGGNDNDGDEHSYQSYNEGHALLNILYKMGRCNVVYDLSSKDYTLQDKISGTVIRVSFKNDEETTKSSFPTLVDISITSFCDFGCKFCYQSSTKKGNHAELEHIKHVLNELKKEGCLEVVFGGGEPTKHPDIIEIISHAKSLGLVVGITTKNMTMTDEMKKILTLVNTMAISFNNESELDDVIRFNKEIPGYPAPRPAIYFQTILGCQPLDFLKNSLNKIKMGNVNLLGYKDFGFGKKQTPHDVTGWIELIKKYTDNIEFGVDSIVVKKFKSELLDAKVNPKTLVGEEGKFSCYIDCVEKTIASSSFTDKTFPFDSNWLSTYKSF